MRAIALILGIAAGVFTASGCSNNDSLVETVHGESTMMDLAGTSWLLSETGEKELPPSSVVTIAFGKDEIAKGLAGCIGYSTSFTTSEDRITFELQGTAETICQEPQMDFSWDYLQGLISASTYELVGMELRLFDEDGDTILKYDAYEPDPLQGTQWQLIDLDDGSESLIPVLPETEISAHFSEDGLLSGSAGCNGYSASYDVTNGSINVAGLVMTEIYCLEPEGLMDQETQYLVDLSDAAAYLLGDDLLAVLNPEGALILRFERDS
jgi:heat shock protein HslJ